MNFVISKVAKKLDKKLGNLRSRPSINSSSEELKNRLSIKRERGKKREHIEISDLRLADARELLKKLLGRRVARDKLSTRARREISRAIIQYLVLCSVHVHACTNPRSQDKLE
jgi:hypothetical protein